MSAPIIWFGNAAKLLKSTLTIPGTTTGTLSISVPASVTSYTVIMPSAQAAGALTNDGSGNLSWSAAGSSVNTVGTYDSQTPAANGLTISGSSIFAQSATLTVPGMVSTGVQSFAGNKTFSGTISASNLSGSNTGDQTITLTGDVTGSGTGSFAATIAPLAVDNSKIATSAAIALTKLAALTNHNRALQSDASGFITESAVTSTELGYSSGVTSAIQTQLDAKVALAGSTMTGPLVLSGDPTLPNGAANKQYVDNLVQGLSAKQSVLVATTSPGVLATSFAAGQTIDGVVLSLTDRILLKDQAAPAENGIYIVTAGTPTRSLDMDTWAEVVGAFTFVEEGTANASSGWVSTAAPGGTIGVTAITFVQFSQAGSITAGIALTKTGNTLDVNVDNSTIDVSSNNLEVKAGGITNTQINASAAIAYSKLALTNSIVNADVNSAAAIAVTKLAALTANRAVATDASGFLTVSATTDAELAFVNGVTSSIQTQLNAKQATGNYITALTGDVTASGPGSATATIANNAITNVKIDAAAAIDASKIANGSVSSTEFQFLDGVTSSIQTQLDSKFSGSLTNAHIFVGNVSNVATDVAVSGDLTLTNTGNFQIATGVITDTDVNSAAAIARTKLANGTANHVVINDGSGTFSSEATLAKTRGGSGQDNSSITFPASGTLATIAGTQTITNKDIDGGTASNSLRLTVPANTTTNLTALTRKAGTIAYDTTLNALVYDNGTQFNALGSSSPPNDSVLSTIPNGYGSTDTAIRRFSTNTTVGTAITLSSTSTNGNVYTINTTGLYAISYSAQFNNASEFGVSINGTALSTAFNSIAANETVCGVHTPAAGLGSTCCATLRLTSGDLIRPQTSQLAAGGNTHVDIFRITRVG